MTFVEEKGNKIAAVLCLASVLPMAGTVYAMETKTMAGNSEKVVSTAQNESDLKTTNYIEDSDVDSTISVKSDISKEITNVVQEAVKENSVEEHYVPKMEVKETPAVEETMEIPLYRMFKNRKLQMYSKNKMKRLMWIQVLMLHRKILKMRH